MRLASYTSLAMKGSISGKECRRRNDRRPGKATFFLLKKYTARPRKQYNTAKIRFSSFLDFFLLVLLIPRVETNGLMVSSIALVSFFKL